MVNLPDASEAGGQEPEAGKGRKDEFIGKIKAKIEHNTFAPEGLTGNPRVEFAIVPSPRARC